MVTSKLLKLAKAILSLGSCNTVDGKVLNWEGELVVGTAVFVEGEDGELAPAQDAEYVTDKQKIVVKDGVVESIEDVEEQPVEEPKEEEVVVEEEEAPVAEPAAEPEQNVDELLKQIDDLKAENEELKNKIAELEQKNQEQEAQLSMSADKPAKDKVQKVVKTFPSYL